MKTNVQTQRERPISYAAGILLTTILILSFDACQGNSSPAAGAKKVMPFVTGEAARSILQAIGKAQAGYVVETGTAYGTFDQLSQQMYLPPDFKGEQVFKNGYKFVMRVTPPTNGLGGFAVSADPELGDGRHFYMDQTLQVHFNDTQPAGSGDPNPQ